MNPGPAQILDCTLRDGGYYTDWHFSGALVSDYLQTMASSPVSVVELGYRQPSVNATSGSFAFTTDDFVSSLSIPAGLRCAVMIDAKRFFGDPADTQRMLGRTFGRASDSPIDVVRVAVQFTEVCSALPQLEYLKRAGYMTCLSLMQIGRADLRVLARACSALQRESTLDVLYFADSFGVMAPGDVRPLVDAIRVGWGGALGFHGHNNKGLALSNALECLRHGVTWIDSTISGMGRGAGNVATEYLIQELLGTGDVENTMSLYRLVAQHFEPLRASHGWGPSLLYHLAGNLNVHPTRVQELVGSGQRNAMEIVNAARALMDLAHSTAAPASRMQR